MTAALGHWSDVNVRLARLGPEQGTDGEAFGAKPTGFPVESSSGDLWAYGLVNLVVISAGVGLVVLGTYLARRRAESRRSVAVL